MSSCRSASIRTTMCLSVGIMLLMAACGSRPGEQAEPLNSTPLSGMAAPQLVSETTASTSTFADDSTADPALSEPEVKLGSVLTDQDNAAAIDGLTTAPPLYQLMPIAGSAGADSGTIVGGLGRDGSYYLIRISDMEVLRLDLEPGSIPQVAVAPDGSVAWTSGRELDVTHDFGKTVTRSQLSSPQFVAPTRDGKPTKQVFTGVGSSTALAPVGADWYVAVENGAAVQLDVVSSANADRSIALPGFTHVLALTATSDETSLVVLGWDDSSSPVEIASMWLQLPIAREAAGEPKSLNIEAITDTSKLAGAYLLPLQGGDVLAFLPTIEFGPDLTSPTFDPATQQATIRATMVRVTSGGVGSPLPVPDDSGLYAVTLGGATQRVAFFGGAAQDSVTTLDPTSGATARTSYGAGTPNRIVVAVVQ
jgi:hypothetical protein